MVYNNVDISNWLLRWGWDGGSFYIYSGTLIIIILNPSPSASALERTLQQRTFENFVAKGEIAPLDRIVIINRLAIEIICCNRKGKRDGDREGGGAPWSSG